ncbi:hypothetical protein LNKW23_18260 [Paralimibaculum aggregatum]|uniref:Uncharacterized protein n=1 Tax=Paralimibaculum aggregatum TaxID=3036245 RepID=A0ABQ6LP76_9RHOB|nr:hypothetical protein [Limibaculum sp. NKW23]GMG82613.1 hypothetical protein LNKW23_18260 [Limibaculum sp. NKW23]
MASLIWVALAAFAVFGIGSQWKGRTVVWPALVAPVLGWLGAVEVAERTALDIVLAGGTVEEAMQTATAGAGVLAGVATIFIGLGLLLFVPGERVLRERIAREERIRCEIRAEIEAEGAAPPSELQTESERKITAARARRAQGR